MATHEPKSCQRCNSLFECKTGTIVQCQCYGINFNEDEKEIIARSFSDCLCRNCLLEIKQEIKYQSLIKKQEQISILLKTR